MTDFLPTFADRLAIGDVVLTGGRDLVSLIIQIGSLSPFSHAAIVTGPDELTEAYDYALTPEEHDEGIYPVSVDDFVGRSPRLRRIRVLRPIGVDQDRVVDIARYLHCHSPGFPSLGMAFLALCGVSGPILRALPAGLRERVTMKQVQLAADGIRRMHCAETVTRIYHEAGLAVRFTAPRLRLHIDQLNRVVRPEPIGLPSQERVATKGAWPGGHQPLKAGRATAVALASLCRTWKERARSTDPIDVADLILPGDFARAEPFDLVGEFVRTADGWTQAA